MFPCNPKVVNTRDSLDHVPVVTLSVPENHPLHVLMQSKAHELHLAAMKWEWEEPTWDCYKKKFPG